MTGHTADLASFVSFLAGGVTAVALALFLAPESAEAARKRRGRKLLRDAAG
jgi:gas vesicle protein